MASLEAQLRRSVHHFGERKAAGTIRCIHGFLTGSKLCVACEQLRRATVASRHKGDRARRVEQNLRELRETNRRRRDEHRNREG